MDMIKDTATIMWGVIIVAALVWVVWESFKIPKKYED